MNPWWAHTIENNRANPVFPDEIRNRRSQDQPPLYCPSGAIWVAKANTLIQSNTFYGPGYTFFPIPWKRALDIDDYEDLEMAELLISQ